VFRQTLTVVFGSVIFFAATAYVVDAEVTRCWFGCGSDVCEATYKGATGKAINSGTEEVECFSSSPRPEDIFTICLTPQGQYLPGRPPSTRTDISGRTRVRANFCEGKIKGQCIVPVELPTQNTDFPSQEEFEDFWGIQKTCNNQWTPVYIFAKRSDVTICVSEFGTVVRTIIAECSYPFDTLQIDADGNIMTVEAPCNVKAEIKGATDLCAP
jgi:hypothetical protein